MNNKTENTVSCPNCKKTVIWNKTSTWRPFCSERCKLIDMGEWIGENHRIPGNPSPTAYDDNDEF